MCHFNYTKFSGRRKIHVNDDDNLPLNEVYKYPKIILQPSQTHQSLGSVSNSEEYVFIMYNKDICFLSFGGSMQASPWDQFLRFQFCYINEAGKMTAPAKTTPAN